MYALVAAFTVGIEAIDQLFGMLLRLIAASLMFVFSIVLCFLVYSVSKIACKGIILRKRCQVFSEKKFFEAGR